MILAGVEEKPIPTFLTHDGNNRRGPRNFISQNRLISNGADDPASRPSPVETRQHGADIRVGPR
jgi:hypothetical protein